MKKLIALVLIALTSGIVVNAQQKPVREPLPADVQVRIAVQAAPTEFREGAKVYGYDKDGKFTVLREGTNGYICLAPDYKLPLLYAYAYPESLEPFMARGRALIAEGKRKERDKIREEEFKAGKLSIPQQPTMLYGYWGSLDKLDKETGEMADAKRRYVLYVPYAKAADLGLASKPTVPGIPWLMDEGSYKAHIMINPADMGHSHGH
ncbi:hypothetical protein ACFU8T_08190 [Sphingobacterium spiritivorum]|uniref:Uncharacterized protein n=1 Tax=Sphingobacterium spiritivorum ATCC 33861 TaxID=525373 RepID=D7VSY4_SPHSI|nr:hypothetical protein [Sphingobacterium spiritivorum]EFK56885.1 hypothetical protein HMPREF0766_14088 [Sphingobacterium spiritivorum ATCC 33861]QQT35093.1 hypothetical protein I6J01_17635 [Sphingobacterium spiritivorum]WQD35996.1 hypothetical protein U0038_09585 [Sphingobacterium spiritivorum]SUJ03251.1 Uncharacterised protein [Sphingobacterium spiritivorum]